MTSSTKNSPTEASRSWKGALCSVSNQVRCSNNNGLFCTQGTRPKALAHRACPGDRAPGPICPCRGQRRFIRTEMRGVGPFPLVWTVHASIATERMAKPLLCMRPRGLTASGLCSWVSLHTQTEVLCSQGHVSLQRLKTKACTLVTYLSLFYDF